LPPSISEVEAPVTDQAGADAGADRYQVPDGGVPELLAFIKAMREYQPPDRAQLVEHRKKSLTAMTEAARKVVASANEVEKQLEGFNDAVGLVLLNRVFQARTASDEEIQQLCADIVSTLSRNATPSRYALTAGFQLGGELSNS